MLSVTVLDSHFKIFEAFGVWEPKPPSYTYRAWQIISLAIIGIGLPLSFFMSILFAQDAEAKVKIPLLMCTILSVTIKCVLIVINRHKFETLLDTLNKMDQFVEISSEIHMKKAFRQIRRIHMAFKISYYGAYGMVFLEFVLKGGTNLFWQSTMLWPWQWAHLPSIYYTILILQVTTNAINCVLAVLTDTLASILCILLDGHLSVLAFRMQHLREKEEILVPLEDIKELIGCIQYHDLCTRYRSLFEQIMSSALLVQFTASVPVICTCIIQLSNAQVITTMELLFIAMYTPNMITQLFAPCKNGSDVAHRGENLLFHLIASNWVTASMQYKRLHLMTLGKLQTSFVSKVGHVIPLSLYTFLTVMKAAYSLYTMLSEANVEK